MVKTLTRHGNSLALVIDKPILEMLRIDENTLLSVSTDGTTLVIAPARDNAREEKFEGALKRVNRKWGSVFKRLAK